MDDSVGDDSLAECLRSFFAEAKASKLLRVGSDRDAAEKLASLPEAHSVRVSARATALANGYPRTVASGDQADVRSSAGRKFDAFALHQLGLVGLLRTGSEVTEALIDQVAGYLAGPGIPIERLVVLDGDLGIEQSIDVAGWELVRPKRDDLAALRPVPAAADHTPRDSWDPLLAFGWNWALRQVDPMQEPDTGHFDRIFPEEMFRYVEPRISAWEPLLFLNLYAAEPVHSVATYTIEPERHIAGGGSIPSTIATWSDEDGEEVEIPQLGPFCCGESEASRLSQFLGHLSRSLARWPPPDRPLKDKEAASDPSIRLRRSATQFLRANQEVADADGPIFVHQRPDVIFRYVAAVEHMLLDNSNDEKMEIARRLSQRAAVLAAWSDEERIEFERTMRHAYTLRSNYAHGSPPSRRIDMAHVVKTLRTILRRAFIARVVLGPRFNAPDVCDKALLSKSLLEAEILGRVTATWETARWQ